MLAIMHQGLSAERRAEIARAAAQARWKKGRAKTTRVTLTLSEDDHAALETLRTRFKLVSHAAVVRRLLRQAMRPNSASPASPLVDRG
jgi:hypothetical protein